MNYDLDDPPPEPTWLDTYWHIANRFAEMTLRQLRFFGFI